MLLDSIKQAQGKRGWTDARLAKELGMHPSQLCRIYQGKRKVNLAFLMGVTMILPEVKRQIGDILKGGK